MFSLLIVYIVFCTLLTVPGCTLVGSESDIIPISSNLIKNSSFEFVGKPSLQNWIVHPEGSPLVKISPGTTVGGGKYSIALRDSGGMAPWVSQSVAVVPGTHAFQISFWFKGSYSNDGVMFVEHTRGDSILYVYGRYVRSEGWTYYSHHDTISCLYGDSVTFAFSPEVFHSDVNDENNTDVYFDLLKLEVIEGD